MPTTMGVLPLVAVPCEGSRDEPLSLTRQESQELAARLLAVVDTGQPMRRTVTATPRFLLWLRQRKETTA